MHKTTLISILSIQQKLATSVPSSPLLSPDWTKATPPESLHGRLTPSNITSLMQMCALSGGKCFSFGGILERSSGGTKTGREEEKETVLQVRVRGYRLNDSISPPSPSSLQEVVCRSYFTIKRRAIALKCQQLYTK